jgi:hypothetical protein
MSVWRRFLLWIGLGLLTPASATFTAGVTVALSVPPLGVADLGPGLGSSTAPLSITGSVEGLPGGPALYKGMILFYGTCGFWWDKGHNSYAHLGPALAATAQNAGVVLAADGSFELPGTPGWGYATSPFDVLSPVIAVFIVPSTMDLSWHADPALLGYVENNPIHDNIWANAVSWLFVDRSRCTAQGVPCDGAGGAVTYVAQQPVFPQVFEYPEGTCPGPYGPPPDGEPILPGGPVPPALPLPPLPSASAPPSALPVVASASPEDSTALAPSPSSSPAFLRSSTVSGASPIAAPLTLMLGVLLFAAYLA